MGLEKKLVIVTGASGEVGEAYLKHYSEAPQTDTLGLHRSTVKREIRGVNYVQADLTDAFRTSEVLNAIDLKNYSAVYLIHPVGQFKWEEDGKPVVDYDGDGIDDHVYLSNIDTFQNMIQPILNQRRANIQEGKSEDVPRLVCVGFGSLSDRHNVPYWQSYTKAKNQLRADIHDLTKKQRGVRAVMVNLPSVATTNEHTTRPHADTSYWMQPSDIVKQTVGDIDALEPDYVEIDRYQHSPHFVQGYYGDHKAVYRNWKGGMTGKSFTE